jgi:transcriptional regulator with XRE-family HTH domain
LLFDSTERFFTMGTKPRHRPQCLASKLRQIRDHLRASQSVMANLLDNELTAARVSEYEHDIREPSLFTLLRYAQVARVRVDDIIDDHSKLVFGRRKRLRRAENEHRPNTA